MTDTTFDTQIQLLGEMAEDLAAGYRNRTMTGWERDDLVRDFRELNAKLAPKETARKKREGTTKPQRSKLNKDGAAVVDTKSEEITLLDACAFALFAIIVITVAITIYGQL